MATHLSFALARVFVILFLILFLSSFIDAQALEGK